MGACGGIQLRRNPKVNDSRANNMKSLTEEIYIDGLGQTYYYIGDAPAGQRVVFFNIILSLAPIQHDLRLSLTSLSKDVV